MPVRRIPRRLDEHTLINRIKALERRVAALETRLARRGGLDPTDPELADRAAPDRSTSRRR